MNKKQITALALAALLPLAAWSQEPIANEDGKKIDKQVMEVQDYMPEIHGTLRAKYEYQPEIDAMRWEVRTARVSFTGNVLPNVAYKAEVDLSDEGSIKMLDAYARLFLAKGFTVTAGQMRVPFTIDAHRSPHQQYFANRSFIAKQVGNVRDVGMTLAYKFQNAPISIEAGLYNGTGLTSQKTAWRHGVNYSAKAEFFPINKKWNITIGAQGIKPVDIFMHSYDVGTYVDVKNFHVEAEYVYKTYSKDAFDDVHAVNVFANYDIPLKKGPFKKISVLARYDYMTDHSDADEDYSAGEAMEVDDYERGRLTGGLTFSLGKAFKVDLRLNYEKYFYAHHSVPATSEQDKLVLELMVRF